MRQGFDEAKHNFKRDLNENVFPMESAYYFYTSRNKSGENVCYMEFYEKMCVALQGEYNQIMDGFKEPLFDADYIIEFMSHFFKEDLLIDKNGEVILII